MLQSNEWLSEKCKCNDSQQKYVITDCYYCKDAEGQGLGNYLCSCCSAVKLKENYPIEEHGEISGSHGGV
jgi:hypothetical protein